MKTKVFWELVNRRSYFSLLGKFSPTHILKVQVPNSSQTNNEDEQGRWNPESHGQKQKQHELDYGVDLLTQDGQELQKLEGKHY